MQFKQSLAVFLAVIALAAASAAGQTHKFKGFNVVVHAPEDHNVGTCAVRFASRNAGMVITDLNPSTPMNIRTCAGTGSRITRLSADRYSMTVEPRSNAFCFEGEDELYRIDSLGDQYSGSQAYYWAAEKPARDAGFYNIRDFGAKGDGTTDDTMAIRGALAYIATRNGGTLRFPEGDYVVGGEQDFRGLTLPSGVAIEGVGGVFTGASTNNPQGKHPSRITLKGSNRSVFLIGECTEQVSIKNLELYAEENRTTRGIKAIGAYLSSQALYFEKMSFNNFYRGMEFYGLPQTTLQWQVDYIKVKQCRFIYNTDAGIFTNTFNSDWRIEGSFFLNPLRTTGQNANSMHFERVGMVLIEDTYGGGFQNRKGGTFINILDSGNITIVGSQTEAMTNSLVYNAVKNPGAGDYSYPITVVNSILGEPIVFNARRTFVSIGSFYLPDTFTADERLRVYSTGDRFCYDGYTLGCQGAAKNNFDKASVIFMTGQPDERGIPGHPTYFGTDVEFAAPPKLPSFRQRDLPGGKPNGSMVYCEDCRRDSSPCRSGGDGAPAMVVNGRWSCL